MELRFDTASRLWMARAPQAGSDSGWSAWYSIDRADALHFIERGWSFTYV